MKWISTAGLLLALGFGWAANQAAAQDLGATNQSFDQLSARLEQQDREIRQLQAQVAGMQPAVNATPVSFAPGGGPATAPAAPADPPCAEVGSDLNIKARFWNGAGIMFETPNRDFTMHIGGWAQWDNVWWNQNTLNNTTIAVGHGNTEAGIGPLSDGDFWRRIRLVLEGNFYETFEYRWNFAFENNQESSIGLDEFWVGDNKIPFIGTVRAGHQKSGMGLEGDMTSSSRCMTFMERSSYSESIELNQNFVTGVLFMNNAFDDRMFWSGEAFRPDPYGNGEYLGTGQWGWQARITGLPIYEDQGRHLLHLGLSFGWRNGTNVNNGVGSSNFVDLSARPEVRDDNTAASPTFISGGTAQYLPEANSTKMVDTGKLYCNQEWILGTELLYIRGPLSFQGEYGWNFCNNAQTNFTGTGSATRGTGPIEDYVFNGGYAQVAYTLTGENRAYDQKTGGLSRYYLGGQGPYENAFLVRDADGNLCSGHGALELAVRCSYIDLNSGFGTTAAHTYVNGGMMRGCGVALNWFLNSNVTVMTDWVYDYRYDLPQSGINGVSATGGKFSGSTNGIGSEVQFSF